MDIAGLLAQFKPISLEEMKGIRLMNRIDTKYVVPISELLSILSDAKQKYYAQQIKGNPLAGYHTAYLDTPDYRMYTMHECGRQVREKIRVRTYEASDINFLEVKNKNNKGRTDKKRISISALSDINQPRSIEFLRTHSWFSPSSLHYSLENHFQRITLVNYAKTERITIDLGIVFHNLDTDGRADLSKLVVIEVKRDGRAHSPIAEILHRHHVVQSGFSKYCIGMAMTNPSLRRNRIKPRLRMIDKLIVNSL